MNVYDSLSERQNPETVLPTAVAIELLRAFVRLRTRLLVTLTDKHGMGFTHPAEHNPAGDEHRRGDPVEGSFDRHEVRVTPMRIAPKP